MDTLTVAKLVQRCVNWITVCQCYLAAECWSVLSLSCSFCRYVTQVLFSI